MHFVYYTIFIPSHFNNMSEPIDRPAMSIESKSNIETTSEINSSAKANLTKNQENQRIGEGSTGAQSKNKQPSKKKSFSKKKFGGGGGNSNTMNSSNNNHNRQHKNRNNRNAYNSNSGGLYDGFDEDQFEHEIFASQLNLRNKKGQISINHLLDWSLPEREQYHGNGNNSYDKRKLRRLRRSDYEKSALHLTGKEFINANFRFIVDYRGNYDTQKLDPNVPLDYNNILRVIIRHGNACPICLDEDLSNAPRMVSCGHCFCYTCLLNYLDSEDGDTNKKTNSVNATNYKSQQKPKKFCPLCATKINPEEILPVLLDSTSFDEKFETPKVNQDAIFKLMVKPHDALIALPISKNPDFAKLGEIPWCCDEYNNINQDVFPYARLMKGNLDFILEQYKVEIDTINETFANDQLMFDSSTEKYVKQAVKAIEDQIDYMKLSFGKPKDYVPEKSSFNEQSIGNLKLEGDEDRTLRYNLGNSYFYYQTNFNSSVKYILSGLDIKILRAVFDDYASFPSTLVLPVENIVFGEVLTENNVNKYKYLSHLPFGTELAFLEINWLLGNRDSSKFRLPDNVFAVFKRELMSRSRNNKRKMQMEEHDRKAALRDLEIRTKEFYERENESFFYPQGDYASRNRGYEDYSSSTSYIPLGSEASVEDQEPLDVGLDELQPLHVHENENEQEKPPQGGNYTTTVWGTRILKSSVTDIDEGQYDDNGIDTEELLRQVQEQQEANKGPGKKKKGKKRLVLLTSSGRGA